MTTLNSDVEVLKQDAGGRVRVTRERREALLDEFERSGVSGAQFARLAGIKYSTFAAWVAKRRRKRAQAGDGDQGTGQGVLQVGVARSRGGALRWCEAVVEGAGGTGAGLRVELPGGSGLVIASPGQLPLVAELVVLIAQSARARC
jgi:hypothetical protein